MFQVGERKTAKVKEGKAKKKTSGNKYQKSVTYKLLRGFLSSRSFVIPSDLKKKIQEKEVVNRVAAEDERRRRKNEKGRPGQHQKQQWQRQQFRIQQKRNAAPDEAVR